MIAAIDWSVRPIPVREEGLVGTLFLPAAPPPYPVVITLGGSAPGVFSPPALLFASQGLAAFALAYFGMEDLPRDLNRIRLEYFHTAIHWCRRRKELRPEAIAVAGASRGGELALLLAATYPEIVAVVGWVPSGVTFAGVVRDRDGPVAAWTREGRDLPFVGFDRSAVDWKQTPIRLTPGFLAAISDTAALAAAEIPVEHINGPVLMISGTDDQVWPSTLLAEVAVLRLRSYQHPFAVEHICYEGAGHNIGPPSPFAPLTTTHAVHPVLGYDFELGGTPERNAQASVDSWGKILEFLNQRFRSVLQAGYTTR
jgi:dienelactone hydrolase